jgi:hypothetical protein
VCASSCTTQVLRVTSVSNHLLMKPLLVETPLNSALRALAKELSCPVWCVRALVPLPSQQGRPLIFLVGAGRAA